jgi:hypothetical protein
VPRALPWRSVPPPVPGLPGAVGPEPGLDAHPKPPARREPAGQASGAKARLPERLPERRLVDEGQVVGLGPASNAFGGTDQVVHREDRSLTASSGYRETGDREFATAECLEVHKTGAESSGSDPRFDQYDPSRDQMVGEVPQGDAEVSRRANIPDRREEAGDHVELLRKSERLHTRPHEPYVRELSTSDRKHRGTWIHACDPKPPSEVTQVFSRTARDVQQQSRVSAAKAADDLADPTRLGGVVLPHVDPIVDLGRVAIRRIRRRFVRRHALRIRSPIINPTGRRRRPRGEDRIERGPRRAPGTAGGSGRARALA